MREKNSKENKLQNFSILFLIIIENQETVFSVCLQILFGLIDKVLFKCAVHIPYLFRIFCIFCILCVKLETLCVPIIIAVVK